MANKKNNKELLKLEKENDLDYIARFACLMYGVNVAADFAEKRGINTEKSNSWIKPIVFQKYIDERYEDMKFNIKQSLKGKENEIHSW
tara:strand:+ start:470 stop:733 length:264 start_codon:yes stop_codon:yes gene_type:complete